MNRIQTTTLFAALFFLVGLLSGNFIAPELATHTDAVPNRAAANTAEMILPTIDLDDVTQIDVDSQTQMNSGQTSDEASPQHMADTSFSHFAEAHVASEETVAANDEDDATDDMFAASELTEASDADVLASIELHFPELPTHVKSGWVDTYSGMPLDDLNVLLEQKKSMPSILQVSSSFLLPDADINIQPVERIQQAPIKHLRSRVIQNLRNASTPGYRRRRTTTSLLVPAPETPSDRITVAAAGFDFTPGAIHLSNNGLHVAIQQAPSAMFRLEPDCVLTRNGQFERLEDGRIGVRGESVTLALAGVDPIPLDAANITFGVDGTVRYKQNNAWKSAGKLALVRVTVPELLSSENGVYFSLPSDLRDEHVVTADNARLMLNAFEESNVVLDQEWQWLDHFERLQTLQDSASATEQAFP